MSSVSSVSGSNQMIYASMNKSQGRPDPAKMAEDLFAKLDTSGQGYIDKGTLEKALGSMGSSDGNSTSAEAIFKALDTDGDSKITKQEMSDSIKKLADGLQSQVNQMRFGGAGEAGGMPPPPPPQGGNDAGMSKDQLSQMAQSATASGNTKAATDLSALVTSFDKADTDQDGSVSVKEAIAFKQSSQTESTSSTSSDTSASSAPDDAKILQRLMQLLHAYGSVASNGDTTDSGSISVSA